MLDDSHVNVWDELPQKLWQLRVMIYDESSVSVER